MGFGQEVEEEGGFWGEGEGGPWDLDEDVVDAGLYL